MGVYLLDTTTLTHLQRKHPKVNAAHAAHAGDVVGVTTVSVEEVVGGWFTALRRAKTKAEEARAAVSLGEAVSFIADFHIFPPTEAAIDRYVTLRKLRLNVGGMDLKIAAIALELSATVVTDNARDFGRVPGLLWEDWTA